MNFAIECYNWRATARGGGGASILHIAYWVCAARETTIFSPKFSLRSISFSQMTKKIRSGASPLYIFLPLQRPSFSRILCVKAFHRHPWPALRSGSALGISGRLEWQPDASYTVSSGDPTFTLELAPEPPILHFAAAHTYQNLGWVPPGGLRFLRFWWLREN